MVNITIDAGRIYHNLSDSVYCRRMLFRTLCEQFVARHSLLRSNIVTFFPHGDNEYDYAPITFRSGEEVIEVSVK